MLSSHNRGGHLTVFVIGNVLDRRLGQDDLSCVIDTEDIVLAQDPVASDLDSILNKPPDDAVDPDVDGKCVRLSTTESQRVDAVWVGGGPGAGEDGGSGQSYAPRAEEDQCWTSRPEEIRPGAR